MKKTTILQHFPAVFASYFRFQPLMLIFAVFLLYGCQKDDSGSNAEANFIITDNYKVLNPTSIQLEVEIVFTKTGTFKSHGFVWSETNPEPTMKDGFTDSGEIKASGKITGTMKDLEYGKIYFYRAYGSAGKGTIIYSGTYKASTAWQPLEKPEGSGLRDGVAMVIGKMAYVGMGADNYDIDKAGNRSGIWEFNSTTDQWTGKKQFPTGGREESFSFVIDGKGYVGGGFSGSTTVFPDYSITHTDFWEYDPVTNQWTLKGDLPANLHRIGFEINGYGYCFNGSVFYRYDPAANDWTPLPFGRQSRIWTTSFVVNGRAYLVGGMSPLAFTSEVLEFDPSTQVWTKKANFPGEPITEAVSFVIDNQAYVGTGYTGATWPLNVSNEFWRYNAENDTWVNIESMPYARQGGLSFSIGNRAFVGVGGDEGRVRNDWWEYIPFK